MKARTQASPRHKAVLAVTLVAFFAGSAVASADSIKLTVPKNYLQSGKITLSGSTSGATREAQLYADAQPCASSDAAESHHPVLVWWGNLSAGRVHNHFSVAAGFPYPTSLRRSRFYLCAYLTYNNNGNSYTTAHMSLSYSGSG